MDSRVHWSLTCRLTSEPDTMGTNWPGFGHLSRQRVGGGAQDLLRTRMAWAGAGTGQCSPLLVLPRSLLPRSSSAASRLHNGGTQSQFGPRTTPGDAAASSEPAQLRARRRATDSDKAAPRPGSDIRPLGAPGHPSVHSAASRGPRK